jgi:hypothetical protein
MIRRRSSLASVLLFFLVGVVGGLLWGDGPAAAANVGSTRTILVKGTVTANVPEMIPFSGKVQIKTVFVPDPDFRLPPLVHVSIDFLDIQGLGQTTKTKYFANGDDEMSRAFRASDELGLTFAIVTEADRITSVGTGLVTLTLTFDTAGNLTSATGSVGDSPFAPNL